MKYDQCLAFTLAEEGGMSLNPHDKGNWLGGKLVGSNMGISAPTLALWLRDAGLPSTPTAVAQAMQRMDIPTASAIYRARYWNTILGDRLPAGVDLMVFDHGVNAGISASVRLLQGLLDTALDGVIGPHTLAAVGTAWPGELIQQLHTAQLRAYEGTQGFAVFGTVWTGRAARRLVRAQEFDKAFKTLITGEVA